MTEEQHEGDAALGGPTPGPELPPGGWPADGWYPDPWMSRQQRYYAAGAWTAHAFSSGPGALPAPPSTPVSIPTFTPASPPASTSASPPRRRSAVKIWAIAAAVTFVVGLLGGYAYSAARDKPRRAAAAPSASDQPAATAPPNSTPAAPSGPIDPAAATLRGLVVRPADVAASVTVSPLVGGDQVTGQATLDLCNATFPSESLRTARLQVAAADAQGNPLLSTEAVLYKGSAATTQAFVELRAAAAKCPAGPVTSPVGAPTITTHFNAAPDGQWPATASVERLAFDFNTTDSSGQVQHGEAIYLRRGRALLGLYFTQVDAPQTAVTGQNSIAGVVGTFASRMAQLPNSVVNG